MKKLGIYTDLGYPVSLERRLELIRDAGFDSVCLDTNSDWEQQMKLAQQYGLPVDGFHLSGDGMTSIWSEWEQAEFVTSRLEKELAHLNAVGVPVGVAHITWGLMRHRHHLCRHFAGFSGSRKRQKSVTFTLLWKIRFLRNMFGMCWTGLTVIMWASATTAATKTHSRRMPTIWTATQTGCSPCICMTMMAIMISTGCLLREP